MLYYNKEETGIGLIEVPGEISLNIVIEGCPIHCPDCHSKHNWEIKDNPLLISTLLDLIDNYKNKVTVFTFMGGEWDIYTLNRYLKFIKEHNLKTCLYTGLRHWYDISNLDYLKTGPYIKELGGLDSKTTNQRFYKIDEGKPIDITSKFWKD